jgi:FHS family glucose/mannose:H+ symporter-like MFS transporter
MSVVDSVVPANRTQLFWGACAGMFVFGIVLAILGTLFGLPEMRERLTIDLAQQGDIFLALYFGVFVSTVVVGPVIDSWGNKPVLVTSAILVALALVLFSTAHSFAAAIVAAFVLGFAGGGLNTSSNALVADLYVENRGAMLNLLGTFFGVGALFIPLLASVITGFFTITQLLLIGAALSAVCAVGFIVMRFPPLQDRVGFSIFASVRAATIPGVLLFAFVLFFQSGNESSISGWISTYIGSLGAPARTATAILAGYWVALMAGRILSAKILSTLSKSTLVLASGIGSAIGAAVLLASNSVTLLAVGAVIIGFSFAPVYPTVLAMAADRYQRIAGTIFGLLFAIGLSGGMAFPWAVGHISQSYGVRSGMVLPLIGSVMITILVVIIRSREGRSVSA